MNSLDHTHRHYFAKLVVQYLAYIPEEAEKVGTFKDNTTAQMKVSQVSHGAIEVIIPYLDYPNLEVQELALNGISSWVSNSTVPMDLLIPLLELVLKKMITFDLLEVISDMLATLFSDKRLASMETVVPELFLPVFVGEVYQSGLKEAIEVENEEFLLPFAKIGSKFGEVYSKYLIEKLPNTFIFFELMLQVTSYSLNPDIPQATFFFWFNLEDSLDYSNELNQKTLSDTVTQNGHEIMHRLLGILVSQMKYGSDQVMSTITKDLKDKMKSHRVECSDTALYCYYNLQDRALELMYTLFNDELQKLSTHTGYGTQGLEAVIYCLKCFAEAVPSDEAKWTPLLFSQNALPFIQQLISTERDGFRQLRLTLASCCGNYSEWLSVQPEYLPSCLNYLLHELANCDQPTSAAISLTELASLCQVPLSKHADEVLNLCMSSLPSIPVHVQSKIIQAMLYIIQALPMQEAMPRSKFILNGIVDQLQQDISTREQTGDSPQLKETLELHLEFYKSFCKGSNKLTVDLDPVGSESKLSAEEYQLGQRVVSNFEQILKFWLFDRDIVSKVSEVIKDTTKCDNPILLHHLPTFLKLLTVAFNASHQSCFLSGAASIMAHSTTQLISNSKNVYEQCSVQIVTIFAEKCSSMASMEQDPDVPFEFFEFYIHVLKKLPQSIQSLNESLCRTLFLHCLVQGLELQEQMSIQAILKFLREFVAMGYENSPLEHFTKNILVLIGAPIIRQIIKVRLINKGIGGGHPSSLVPKLGQTLFQFFVFFPVATQEGMIACLQEPDFPSRKVNDVEKQAFIKSLAGIRKVKLFNDTVRAFSAKCRGL